MTIDSVTSAPTAATARPATAASTEDRFLRLLVAQMRNQDPLNPLDNAQVTSQMAQLSTVSGLEKINATLGTVLSSLSLQQGVAAAGLIGSQVAVPGDAIALATGTTARGGYSLPQAVDKLTVAVRDASGAVVRTLELGPRGAGIGSFDWDGKNDAGKAVPSGSYTFAIEATSGGKPAAATTLAIGTVQGVIPASDGFALNLGPAGIVPFGAIAQILSKPS